MNRHHCAVVKEVWKRIALCVRRSGGGGQHKRQQNKKPTTKKGNAPRSGFVYVCVSSRFVFGGRACVGVGVYRGRVSRTGVVARGDGGSLRGVMGVLAGGKGQGSIRTRTRTRARQRTRTRLQSGLSGGWRGPVLTGKMNYICRTCRGDFYSIERPPSPPPGGKTSHSAHKVESCDRRHFF